MTDDFFDPLPEPPTPEPHEPPVWFQPPTDELATLVPVRQLLARTDRGVLVLLSHIDAFRQGCSFRIRISAHRPEAMNDSEWHEIHEMAMGGASFHSRRSGAASPDESLRFGVQFRDGRKVTTMDGLRLPHSHDQEPEGSLLTQHGGGGSGSDRFATFSSSLWLWPLPPAEPFDFVIAWPALDVGLTRVELPGHDIVEAASRAGCVWPDATT
jgi:hypothetical protein